MSATEYVSIVGLDEIGADVTEADLDEYCDAATEWLTEHEGADLSILVRPPRRGEVTGTFAIRAGAPFGPSLRASDGEEYARVVELLEEVWERWCAGERLTHESPATR